MNGAFNETQTHKVCQSCLLIITPSLVVSNLKGLSKQTPIDGIVWLSIEDRQILFSLVIDLA